MTKKYQEIGEEGSAGTEEFEATDYGILTQKQGKFKSIRNATFIQ
jgi:hypothetical protein